MVGYTLFFNRKICPPSKLVKYALLLYCENMPSFTGKIPVPFPGGYGSYKGREGLTGKTYPLVYWEDMPSYTEKIRPPILKLDGEGQLITDPPPTS